MWRRIHLPVGRVAVVALAVCGALPGAARAQQPSPASPPAAESLVRATAPDTDQNYRIGPGDVLEIRVFNQAQLSRDVRVTNKGRIRMLFIGEIEAACLTEGELSEVITGKYKKYMQDPQVDVIVKDYKSQPVAVIGSVTTPGRYQLQRRVRLLELLTFAGGPNAAAGGTVHIIRGGVKNFCALSEGGEASLARGQSAEPAAAGEEPGRPMLLSFKLREVLAGSGSANVDIDPGDIISVPEAEQVFVTGGVVRPGPLPLHQKVTLLQAISMAGGFGQDAARNRVRLIRQESGGEVRNEMVFNVDDIEKRRAEDVLLQPNDVIEVPSSTAKVVARGLLGVGVGLVGSLPWYIVR